MSLEKLLDQQHREVQSLTREQLQQLDRTLEQARQDLGTRLADERQRHGDERFTAQRLKATRQLVEAGVQQTSQLLGRQVTETHTEARATADRHVEGQAREGEGRGVAQRLDIQTSLRLAEPNSTLIERSQGLANSYGRETVRALKTRLSLATLTGQTTDEVIEDLVKPGGLLDGERYRARRIVQTELSYAYNGRIMEQIKARGAKKRLLNILDNRTAPDTLAIIALPGNLVREADDPFVDPTTGRTFQFPPNRPNDRATIAIFFGTEREQQAADREREKAEKLADPKERKRIREEREKKLREDAKKSQAERDAKVKEAVERRKAERAQRSRNQQTQPTPPAPVVPPISSIPSIQSIEPAIPPGGEQFAVGMPPDLEPIMQPTAAARLDQIAEEIRNQETETTVVLDPNGNELGRQTSGLRSFVGIDQVASALPGNLIIHNHPDSLVPSAADMDIAARYLVAESRITTRIDVGNYRLDFAFRVQKGGKLWTKANQINASPLAAQPQLVRDVREEIRSTLSIAHSRITRDLGRGRNIQDLNYRDQLGIDPDLWMMHLATIRVAREWGLEYWIELRRKSLP